MRNAIENVHALVRLGIVCLLGFVVASCGGGGGGGSAAAGSKLFVADAGNSAIGSVSNTNPSPGAVPVERIMRGNGIDSQMSALLLDPSRDQLYVANGIQVVEFNNASTANGTVSSNRTIATIVGGGNFNSLQYDSARDMLYVGDLSNGVRIYNNASTSNELGGPSRLPDRTITTADIGITIGVRDIALDTVRDILYIAVSALPSNPATTSILVFDHASNPNPTPDRTISLGAISATTMGLFVDGTHNRLYFAIQGGVQVYETASTKSDLGTNTPDKTILIQGSPVIYRLAVDTVNDRLYAAAGTTALYIVSNVSTLPSGLATATAALPNAGGNFTAVAVRP
ncbi:MAG TPA: hypothetical protein VHB46_11235 [Burkholderiales bacterium]|nr:hypothetical protein [Burkholderiales bacterium]